jgi:AraC family carnitine catabolism transcriptional activator
VKTHSEHNSVCDILVLVTPYFNLATTTAFLDPFRAANYLSGESRFRWKLLSVEGTEVPCSNGLIIQTQALDDYTKSTPDMIVVSSSWTPEKHHTREVTTALNTWSRRGVKIGALDTGTFILARTGLLKNRHATVHYEHLDALSEQFPDIKASENLYVIDEDRFTCCGGSASTDLALQLLRDYHGSGFANSVARYLFHHKVRGPEASQNPEQSEPFGQSTPAIVRQAIQMMEAHLESPLAIPDICERLNVSQRHLNRQFTLYVNKSPVMYYRDIRLDRARCLVTQTELKLAEVAVACGFSSQAHFTRCYQQRFGLAPGKDRVVGRVPFEFRAWPMYNPGSS